MMARWRVSTLLVAAMFSPHGMALSPEQVFIKASPYVVGISTGSQQGATGSAVVIAPAQVVTNCHLLTDAKTIRVLYHDQALQATLRYEDRPMNLCQLSVDGLAAPVAELAMLESLKIGQSVYAISYSGGLSLSDGLVSALRDVQGVRRIQTSAPIAEGASGGGLFDSDGRLVGIINFRKTLGQSLNFALPVDWLAGIQQRAQAQSEKHVDWIGLAIALGRESDWQGLLKLTQDWLAAEPNASDVFYLAGQAYDALGQYSAALEAYQKALQIDPNNAATWASLSSDYLALKQPDKALEAAQSGLRADSQQAAAWVSLGLAYAQLQQADKAQEALQKATSLDPTSARAWYHLGDFYFGRKQYDRANNAFWAALRIAPGSLVAREQYGISLAITNQPKRAIEALNIVVNTQPSSPACLFLGLSYIALQRPQQAVPALKKAIDIGGPTTGQAWYALGNAYTGLRQWNEAIQAYQQAVENTPENSDAWLSLIQRYRFLSRSAEAMKYAEMAVQKQSQEPRLLAILGDLYLASEQPGLAVAAYQRALNAKPDALPVWFGMGYSQHLLGERAKVREVYEQIRKINALAGRDFHGWLMLPYGEQP